MYNKLGANIDTDFHIPAEHAWLTDTYGNECAFKGEPFINNCEISGALKIFQKIFNGPNRTINTSSGTVSSNLMTFDQGVYKKSGYVMNEIGYYYVPTAC
jgi:hypothetical protein